MKDKTTALILSALLGGLGIDRFYLGYTGMGILKLLTGGCFGVLWILDIIYIATGKLGPADGSSFSTEEFSFTQSNPKPQTDKFEDLKKLADLHAQGILTDEEYEKLKADCLAKL